MSFIKRNETQGKVYAPGYFLASEDCTRITHQFKQDDANVQTAENGGKYIPMGTVIYGENGTSVEGIVYEDVDVTYGDMPGSLVVSGSVYFERLKNTKDDISELQLAGFKVLSDGSADETTEGGNS